MYFMLDKPSSMTAQLPRFVVIYYGEMCRIRNLNEVCYAAIKKISICTANTICVAIFKLLLCSEHLTDYGIIELSLIDAGQFEFW